jgi:methylated-DNA-[protein]-cysteine S-methyltransferase
MIITTNAHAITGVYFVGQKYGPTPSQCGLAAPGDPLLSVAARQLREYVAGAREHFDVPFDPTGTPFQRRVWRALGDIPFGQTVTYSEIATRIGSPRAVRAVGAAIGRNPISVAVPCHRVVGASGSLTGYAGGLRRKRALLDLEARRT